MRVNFIHETIYKILLSCLGESQLLGRILYVRRPMRYFSLLNLDRCHTMVLVKLYKETPPTCLVEGQLLIQYNVLHESTVRDNGNIWPSGVRQRRKLLLKKPLKSPSPLSQRLSIRGVQSFFGREYWIEAQLIPRQIWELRLQYSLG